ncbi:hypothetical protein Golob_010067 [Gossypium lobatum]|uniref:GDPGP1-like N-terminal domain-containing protein n=1 Tax=Gossypium lobatum TaxID=34289 RepID=A0A7J8MKM8_9ROSI|nr:hypothetical protein [Gossypium lobatum]
MLLLRMVNVFSYRFLLLQSFWPLENTLEERSGSAGPSWAGFVHLTTALRREPCEKIRRGKECMQAFPKFLIASPSFHGGRGALPSAGGHPADLTYLAGGIRTTFIQMVTVKWLEDKSFLAKNGKSKQLEDSFSFLQGMNFPIYCFGIQSLEEDTSFEGISCIIEEEQSILDAVLLSQWEDRMLKDCFKYDVTTSEIKVVTGKMKFLCQLNEGQITDHLSKSEGNTLLELDPFVFDCVKQQEELLFCLANSKKAKSELIPSASVPDSAVLVIINVRPKYCLTFDCKFSSCVKMVTPIEYGHVYLVPCASNRLYRFLDARSTEIITRLATEINNQSFRIFYNCYIPNCSGVYFEV